MKPLQSFRRVLQTLGRYHLSTYSASAAFFILSAVFPLIILILSILSFTPFETADIEELLTSILPAGLEGVISFLTTGILLPSFSAFSLSLVIVLWTASKSMLGLVYGLNAIWGVEDSMNYILRRLMCMLYTLILITGILLTLSLRVFGEHILEYLLNMASPLYDLFSHLMALRGLVLFAVMSLIFTSMYTFFPSRKMYFWYQVPGGMFAALGWFLFSGLFSAYIRLAGHTSAVYGSLSTLMFTLLWLYFCMYIVFLGAVLNKTYPKLLLDYLTDRENRMDDARSARQDSARDN